MASPTRGIALLKLFMKKLQRALYITRKPYFYSEEEADLPEDVKEGHFAVFTVDGSGKSKRFVIDLGYLTHPEFLKLLEQAEEEFGFKQEGALAVPCRPDDLQRILTDGREGRGEGGGWNPMIASC